MLKSLRATGVGIALVLALGLTTACQPTTTAKVTNSVRVGCGFGTTSVSVDWFFPVGTPKGLVWLQHGFTESNSDWDTFGRDAAAKGYLAMATTLPTANVFGCTVSNIGNNTPFLNNVAALIAGGNDPTSTLGRSHADAAVKANRAGQAMPATMVFTGHSAGGEAATYVANRLRTNHAASFARLKGMVLQDPVKSFIGDNLTASLDGLRTTALPIYALAAPKYSCNADQSGTVELINRLPGRFHGAQITTGAHGDVFGTSQNSLGQSTCGAPQAKNVAATRTLTFGWFADQLAGTTTATYYPGGAAYQGLISAGTITTLP